ncbi:hypothetical protein RHEC894_PC00172 (plasmid) [Rhizobium sp. CIAT894]|nr:hypothetical protein RHEC894_PC00172 [Rhizobium sp. CIAT894]PDT06643.1 hypothetical protein CO655_31565 [Rhizobium sp. M1]
MLGDIFGRLYDNLSNIFEESHIENDCLALGAGVPRFPRPTECRAVGAEHSRMRLAGPHNAWSLTQRCPLFREKPQTFRD